jgi:hypothetical protein
LSNNLEVILMGSAVAEVEGVPFKNTTLQNKGGVWTNGDGSISIEREPFAHKSSARIVEMSIHKDGIATTTNSMKFKQESGKLESFSVTQVFKEMESKKEKGEIRTIQLGVGVENEGRWMREFKAEAEKGGDTATYMGNRMKKVPGGWHFKGSKQEIGIDRDFTRVDESQKGSQGEVDYTKTFDESGKLHSYKAVSRGMKRGRGISHRGGTIVDLDIAYEEDEMRKLRLHPDVDLGGEKKVSGSKPYE